MGLISILASMMKWDKPSMKHIDKKTKQTTLEHFKIAC